MTKLKGNIKLPPSAALPFEGIGEEDHYRYLMLFDDHPKVDDILINPQSITR